jgi:hypothetical protein
MKYLTKKIVRRLIIIDFLLLCVVSVLFMKTAIYKLIFVGIITLALMVVLLLLQIKNILPEIYE